MTIIQLLVRIQDTKQVRVQNVVRRTSQPATARMPKCYYWHIYRLLSAYSERAINYLNANNARTLFKPTQKQLFKQFRLIVVGKTRNHACRQSEHQETVP